MAEAKIKKVEKRSGKVKPDSFGKYKETFSKGKVEAKKCRTCPWAIDCKEVGVKK
jgi:hypothetical protein